MTFCVCKLVAFMQTGSSFQSQGMRTRIAPLRAGKVDEGQLAARDVLRLQVGGLDADRDDEVAARALPVHLRASHMPALLPPTETQPAEQRAQHGQLEQDHVAGVWTTTDKMRWPCELSPFICVLATCLRCCSLQHAELSMACVTQPHHKGR